MGVTAILGGRFDPPHDGHVALARAACERFGADRLLVTVVADAGHKRSVAPAEARLELARLAFADVPGAEVELEPHGRTVDALAARALPDTVFVIGADELADLPAWKEPERLLELTRLGVATRPGYPCERLEPVLERYGRDRIELFELEPLPVSSTEVRDRVRRGEPIEGLVPPAVARRIAELGLYRGD